MRCRIQTKGWYRLAVLLALATGLVETSSAVVKPNIYELSGKRVQVTYSTSSLSGERRLHYRDRKIDLTFMGDEIRVTPSEIGELVSVTILQVPDLKTVTATVLIPWINLAEEPVTFKAYLIKTTHQTSIGDADLVRRQPQSYATRALAGKASHVDFIHSNLSGEVTLSPTCPGPISPGRDCVQPFEGAWIQVLDTAMNIAASEVTDGNGMFAVHVTPGKYTVRAGRLQVGSPAIPLSLTASGAPGIESLAPLTTAPDISLPVLPVCPDTPVTVPEQGSVFFRMDCDTGIR